MCDAGINSNPLIKKKLLFANCISYELKQKSRYNGGCGRNVLKRMIAGNILRKYKLVHFAEKLIGVKVRNMKSDKKTSRDKESVRKIREFLTREDNARQIPGKNDSKK